jgi:hypothetical protein
MAGTQVQFRRGTTAEHASFTGAVGEVTVDTTKDTLVVHDGSLAGGHPLAKANQIIVGNTSVTVTDTGSDGKVVIATDGAERIIIDPANAYGVLTTQGATGYIANVVASGDGVRGIWAANANSEVRFGSNTNHPLALYTNNGERMRITSNGNVGIGTSSTTERLTVEEENGCMVLVKTSTSGFASCTVQYGTQGTVGLASGDGAHSIYGDGAIPLLFYTNATERMRITSDGNLISSTLYANTSSGGRDVQIASDGTFYSVSSSLKYKTDIETLDYALVDNAISNLRPVFYRDKEPKGDVKEGWSHIGLIAEEAAEVEPRIVHYKTMEVTFENEEVAEGERPSQKRIETVLDEPVPEGIDYARLSILCLAELQKQREVIAGLTARIEALENA